MYKKVLVFFVVFLMSLPVFAETKVSTEWSVVNGSQIHCLKVATDVLWFNHFKNKKSEETHSKTSAWGRRGDYKAVVRCVAEQDVAFFVVTGPEGKTTRQYVDELAHSFLQEMLNN